MRRIDAGIPCPIGFQMDAAGLAGEPVAITAPWPVFRAFDEGTLYWIAVHIAKLLPELPSREDVEVVVVELPKARSVASQLLRGFRLKCAENDAKLPLVWFAQKQVNVLRHEDVAVDMESMALPEAFQRVEKDNAGVVTVDIGAAFVTAEGDEVVMAEVLVALQAARHVEDGTAQGGPFIDAVCTCTGLGRA